MVLRMKAPLLTDIPGRIDFLTTRVAVEAAVNNCPERECAQAEAPGGARLARDRQIRDVIRGCVRTRTETRPIAGWRWQWPNERTRLAAVSGVAGAGC